VGKFEGPIFLLAADDLKASPLLWQSPLIQSGRVSPIVDLPDLYFPPEFMEKWRNINREPHWTRKIIQFNKFYLFHMRFKQYDYVLYLDCGIHVLAPVAPMLAEAEPGTLLAHSDAYPDYKWTLDSQFDKTKPEFLELVRNYGQGGGLWMDYFQTTMMLFSTQIIHDDTLNDLYQLALKYPISITNDQGIIALYFTCIIPVFRQLRIYNGEIHLYDYMFRETKNYIMVKSYRFASECV
jgi:hypothetical protein